MHSLLRVPYAALGASAELAAAIAPSGTAKWQRALNARRGLLARYQAFAAVRDPARQLLWFHAPSVGEALQALPVMQRLQTGGFAGQMAFTWYSPSAAAFAHRFGADFRDYLPFDTGRGARTALGALRPAALVYAKADVWPVLTARAADRHVRLALVAATLRPGSTRRGGMASRLLGDAYARLDLVGAIHADDAERLVAFGVRPEAIRVTGDPRFDQVWDRVHAADSAQALVARLASDRPTVVAGSTWPADDGPLTQAWERVREANPRARLIIAPHEPTQAHLAPLMAWGARQRLAVATADAPKASDADVIVIDRVGVLAELYALGQVAFVGGGFHTAGLHSVLEPAAVGVPVVFGPHWDASADAGPLMAAGAAKAVRAAPDLASALLGYLSGSEEARIAGQAAEAFVRAGLGAAVRSADLVAALL